MVKPLTQLREFIHEVVSASSAYMKKERRRKLIQQLILNEVRSGEITSQAELEAFLADTNLALTSLKMIPFSVWEQM